MTLPPNSPAIPSVGYIVCDNEAVWSAGTTADEAWEAMLSMMRCDHVYVIDDRGHRSATQRSGDAYIMQDGMSDWVLVSYFKIEPASAALVAHVKSGGADVARETIGGVSCTCAEVQALIDAEEA